MPSSVTYLGQSAGDAVGSTSEDVTIDLGTAAAGDKIVVVILQADWAGGASAPSTVTIDGQTGVSAMTPISSGSEYAAIWYFDDSAGAVGGSSTITVTFATAERLEMVAAYRLVDVVDGAATVSASQNTTGTVSTVSLSVNADAIVIAGSIGRRTADDAATWVGVTEDNETTGQNGEYQCSTGSVKAVATETPRTVTCTWDASQTRLLGIAATWDQVSAGGVSGGQPGIESRHLVSGRIGGPSRRVAA